MLSGRFPKGDTKGGCKDGEMRNYLIKRIILAKNGARGRNRTTDTRIFNPLLYP